MKDLLKNFLYTGVGLVALASEKLQVAVDDLVAQGKLSQDEGKKIVDDFFKTSESKREELESRVRKMTENFTGKFDFFSKEEVGDVRDRLEELEEKLTDAPKQVVETAKETVKAVKKNTRKKVEA
jgi:polyhydroxyalkanoate synthesis regulator phasin